MIKVQRWWNLSYLLQTQVVHCPSAFTSLSAILGKSLVEKISHADQSHYIRAMPYGTDATNSSANHNHNPKAEYSEYSAFFFRKEKSWYIQGHSNFISQKEKEAHMEFWIYKLHRKISCCVNIIM